MSKHLNDLLGQRARIWEQMRAIETPAETEGRALTAEERGAWDAAERDMTSLSETIERLERSERMAAIATVEELDERDGETGADQYAAAFSQFLRSGVNDLGADERAMLQANFRAQGTGTGGAGGYLVPEGYWAKMTERLKAFGGILGKANVINTTTGNDLPWPGSDDTGNIGALLAENDQVTEQDIAFTTNTLKAHTYTSKAIRVSLQLMQDSAFDLDSFVPRKAGERIGRALAAHLASGNGTTQPQGITVGASVGKTGAAGQVSSVTYDDLVDLEHSVDPAYRLNGSYVLSDAMVAALRKLKDNEGRPLWQPSLTAGIASTINGYSYVVDNSMPAPAASAKSIAFGDFNAGFVVRQAAGGTLLRLVERYADYLQVGFISFARFDARVDDAAAIKLYAHPAA